MSFQEKLQALRKEKGLSQENLGEFTWYHGYEEIYYNDKKVYECIFHGGCVK